MELIPKVEESWLDLSKAREEVINLAMNGQIQEARES